MIHHFSIPARNPELVARILARFLKGKAYPFSPVEGGYIAVALDDYGTAIKLFLTLEKMVAVRRKGQSESIDDQ